MALFYWPCKRVFSKLWKNTVDRSLFAALVTAFHKAKAIASIMTQAERVLSRFGSDLNTIAAILGMPYKRIWNWWNSGFIPQNWHARLLAEARLRGLAGGVTQAIVGGMRGYTEVIVQAVKDGVDAATRVAAQQARRAVAAT